MGLAYKNLDAETRCLMFEEIDYDVAAGITYLSNYPAPNGVQTWVELLKQAAQYDGSFAAQLRKPGVLKLEVERKKPTGGFTMVKVPVTAPETMAEGEFNRFYIRALCRRALKTSNSTVVVYRSRASENPRPESEALIGKVLDASKLLYDLRLSPGADAGLGLAKPNSGISVQLP
jgi:hypothetical protein